MSGFKRGFGTLYVIRVQEKDYKGILKILKR